MLFEFILAKWLNFKIIANVLTYECNVLNNNLIIVFDLLQMCLHIHIKHQNLLVFDIAHVNQYKPDFYESIWPYKQLVHKA